MLVNKQNKLKYMETVCHSSDSKAFYLLSLKQIISKCQATQVR